MSLLMSWARHPLAASLHGDWKIGLHVAAMGRALSPQLGTLTAHVWSHRQPFYNLCSTFGGGFGLSVFPSPGCGLLGPGTTSDSSLGTEQLLNKCLLNEWTHEE